MLVHHRPWSFRIVALSAIVASANSALAGDRTLAEIVSKDSTLCATIDVERAAKQWETLALIRLWRDPEVQAFVEPLLKQSDASPDLKKIEGLKFFAEQYGLPQIIDGKVEIAIVGYAMHKDGGGISWCDAATAFSAPPAATPGPAFIPELALLIDTAGQESFGASLERMLEIDPSIEVTEGEADGVPYHVAKIPTETTNLADPLEFYFTFVNDKFLVAMRESRLVELVKGLRAEAAPAESLGTDKSYQRWAKACLRGGELISAYVGLKTLMPTIVAQDKSKSGLDKAQKSNLEALGFDRAEGAGMRIGLENGRISDSYSIIVPEQRTGLLRILDALQPGSAIVDNVKGNSAAHFEVRVDPAMVVNVALDALKDMDPSAHEDAEKGFAEMSEQLGFDLRGELIASLGADLMISASLPKSGFIPDVVGSMELRDVAKFQTILPKLKEAATKSSGGTATFQDIVLKEGDPGFYLKSNDMLSVAPSFAVRNGKLLFSLSTSGLKKLVAAMSKEPAPDASPNADLKACLATTVGRDRVRPGHGPDVPARGVRAVARSARRQQVPLARDDRLVLLRFLADPSVLRRRGVVRRLVADRWRHSSGLRHRRRDHGESEEADSARRTESGTAGGGRSRSALRRCAERHVERWRQDHGNHRELAGSRSRSDGRRQDHLDRW